MWTCSNCGEQHENQFKECWKCFGKEMQHAVTATPPVPKMPEAPRVLRSLGGVLVRVIIAACIGMLIGIAVTHRNGASLADALSAGAIVGGIVAVCVGILFWVLFPYEPVIAAKEILEEHEQSRHSPD